MKNLFLKSALPVGIGCILTIITLFGLLSTGCKKNGVNTGYFYANWSCRGSAQCAAILGAYEGTDGAFCTLAACDAWGNRFVPSGYTCDELIKTEPLLGGIPSGTCDSSTSF